MDGVSLILLGGVVLCCVVLREEEVATGLELGMGRKGWEG